MTKLTEGNIHRRCPIPEGPELKISKELISPLVIGQCINKIIVGPKSRYANIQPEGLEQFHNSFVDILDVKNSDQQVKITDVNVKGKFMYWTFSNDYVMFCTFGMSGQMSPKAGKHVCLEIQLYDDPSLVIDAGWSSIFFNDPRHFGTIKFVNSKKYLFNKLNELGWDPFTVFDDKEKKFIINSLKNSSKNICEDLMNQKIFAGVGNYIKSESLYLSKLSPWKLSSSLTEDAVINLCNNIVSIMQNSYNHQGATISTYKDAYGAEGKYSSQFKVYSKKIDPHGYKIIKEKTPDDRTTHWCPDVQH